MIHERPRKFAARIASRALSLGLLLCLASDCDQVFSAFIEFDPAPKLMKVIPGRGSTAGDLMLTLEGTNLFNAKISIAGNDALGTCDQDGLHCHVTLPPKPGAFGYVPVVVTNPATGKRLTYDNLFSYYSSQIAFAATHIEVPVGSNTTAVAVGQFDRDGILDIVVAVHALGCVSLLSGKGDGTFKESPYSKCTNTSDDPDDYPEALVVGDFNGDMNADVAVANSFHTMPKDGTVSVLVGNGDGGLAGLPPVSSGGMNPYSLAIIHALGRGMRPAGLDLVVANQSTSGKVMLLTNDGAGLLKLDPKFYFGTNPLSLAVGRFNRDSYDDIAVISDESDTVDLLIQDANGDFKQDPRIIGTEVTAKAVFAGSIRSPKDEWSDLAFPNYLYKNVSLLLNSPSGLQQHNPTPPIGLKPVSLEFGDFDGDGVSDLAVANYGDDSISVLRGKGMGAFEPIAPITVAPLTGTRHPSSVAVGDFNGDFKADLAIAYREGGDVTILLNDSQ